jgi:hypothetical protein
MPGYPHCRRPRCRASHLLPSCLALLIASAFVHPVSANPNPADQHSTPVGPRVTHRTGLALAGLHCQVRDDIVSPLRWDGIGGSLEFFRDRLSESSRGQLSLKLPLALLTNRYEHRAAAPGLEFGYGRLYRVSWFAGSGATFTGAVLQGNMDLQYYVDWDEEHLYWITTYDLAATTQHEIRIRRHQQLVFRIAIPPVALVSRPPRRRFNKVDDFKHLGFWFRKPNEGLHLTSISRYLSVTSSARYLFTLNDSWKLGAVYELGYRRFSRPEPIRMLTHSLSVRILHES